MIRYIYILMAVIVLCTFSNNIQAQCTPPAGVSITVSPGSTICTGQSVTFTASATNSLSNSTFVWYVNGSSQFSSNTVKTFTTSTLTNGQQVYCTMYGTGCPGVTYTSSNTITMTVAATPSVSIVADKSGTICQGTPVTFTATATNGGSSPVYNWQVNGTTVSSAGPTFTSSTLANGNGVRCVLSTSTCGSVNSNIIGMSIMSTVTNASVTFTLSKPSPICVGTSETFTATPVNGGASPTYKWYANGGEVVGVTGNVFTTSTLNTGNQTILCALYSSNQCTAATTTTNTINVLPMVTPSVTITSSAGASSCTGQSVTFTATPVNGGTAPTYKWFLNNVQVAGVTTNTYTTSTLAAGTQNVYCTLTSNALCTTAPTANSNTISVVVGQTVTPSVSIVATATTSCAGSPVTFTATPVNGGSLPAYKWYVNNVVVNGATSSIYTTSTLSVGTQNVKCVLTSNASCASTTTATSNTIAVSILANVTPSVTIKASTGSPIYAGTSVTFTATPVNGGTSPIYAWYISGTLVSGITGNTFTKNNFSVGFETVTCKMTSNASCPSSNNVMSNALPIAIIDSPYCTASATALNTTPSTDKNYVVLYAVHQPGITDPFNKNNTTCQVTPIIKYFDDLGRLIQTVGVKASASYRDVILPAAYNAYGLQDKTYLSYAATTATSDGSFKSSAIADQLSFYTNPGGSNAPGIASTTYPYSQALFEPSQLNRVVESGYPGSSWQLSTSSATDKGHTVKTIFSVNNTTIFSATPVTNNPGSKRVALYKVTINADRSRTLVRANNNAVYNAKTLNVEVTQNENWISTDGCVGTTEQYKDVEGRLIVKRMYNKNGSVIEMLSTYYVYDDLGNLSFVLPPAANPDADAAITQTTLDNLCFQYKYDTRNRMTDKKIPGKGWETIIYNKIHQAVMTQDAVQRANSPQEWTFIKYDVLGRTVMTGRYLNTSALDIQAQVDAQTVVYESPISTGNGYTTNTFPSTWSDTYAINYYDDYSFPGGATYTYSNASVMTKGLLTGTRINVLGTSTMLLSETFYDDRGRIEKIFSQHYLGGSAATNNYMEITNAYNFDNAIVTTLQSVKIGGAEQTKVLTEYEYDHMGRKVRVWEKVNADIKVLIAQYVYNEVGQVIEKNLHSVDNGSSFKQSIDNRYNTRGWLTSINNSQLTNDGVINNDVGDLFGMELGYNVDIGSGNALQYSGNIAAAKWSNDLGLGSVKEKAFNYGYDAMNRITAAAYKEKTSTWSAFTNNGFSESGYTYDLNGNIKGLTRYDKRGSATAMDILTYDYGTSGNQLLKVTDGGDKFTGFLDGTNTGNDYTYDVNGNMLTDQNKGITSAITYNMMNLPMQVTRGGNKLNWIYDANGGKLSEITTFGSQIKRTDYIAALTYENNVLQYIKHDEGRIVMVDLKLKYTNSCDGVAEFTPANATTTVNPVTQNGTEKYVKVLSSGTTTRSGVFPIGPAFNVVAGEIYKIRARGYNDKGTASSASAAYFLIRGNGTTDIGWQGSALPSSLSTAVTESWAEQTVTIPSGITTIQVGVVWNTVKAGEVIYLDDFEITKLSANASPEYQYDIRDHLGNSHLTFTTKTDIDANLATMELANRSAEAGKFSRYDRVRIVNNQPLFDHTNDPNSGAAIRLSGNDNEKTGLVKTLAVMPGDVVQMEVYAKYMDTDQTKWTTAVANLVSSISSGSASVVTDGTSYPTNPSNPFPYTGWNGTGSSLGNGPKAYLNYIMFDKDFNPILTDPSQTWYVRMTNTGREDGSLAPNGVAHELLTASVTVKQPGYMYIYLSNEEATPVEVYFDDFKVTQTKSPVIQTQDYYPFGLTFNSCTRENSMFDRFLYNKKEIQNELNLGWYNYGARMYMADIGRWGVIDPLAEKMTRHSPYNYAFDNPIRYIDPDGRGPGDPNDPRNQHPPADHPGSFVPSKETADKLEKAKQHLSNVFDGGIKGEAKVLGGSIKGQVGPVKGELSGSVAKASVEVNKKGTEISAQGINGSAKISFASAEGELSATGVSGKATINQDGITTEGTTILDEQNRTANLTIGDDGFEMTADNSTKVALGGSASLFGVGLRAEGSVNFGEAVQGVATLVDAGLSYVADLFKR
jgi:RHS repeat-associated protein